MRVVIRDKSKPGTVCVEDIDVAHRIYVKARTPEGYYFKLCSDGIALYNWCVVSVTYCGSGETYGSPEEAIERAFDNGFTVYEFRDVQEFGRRLAGLPVEEATHMSSPFEGAVAIRETPSGGSNHWYVNVPGHPAYMTRGQAEYAAKAINMHAEFTGTTEAIYQELDWVRRMVFSLGVLARNDVACERSTALSDSVQERISTLSDTLAALLKEVKP